MELKWSGGVKSDNVKSAKMAQHLVRAYSLHGKGKGRQSSCIFSIYKRRLIRALPELLLWGKPTRIDYAWQYAQIHYFIAIFSEK